MTVLAHVGLPIVYDLSPQYQKVETDRVAAALVELTDFC